AMQRHQSRLRSRRTEKRRGRHLCCASVLGINRIVFKLHRQGIWSAPRILGSPACAIIFYPNSLCPPKRRIRLVLIFLMAMDFVLSAKIFTCTPGTRDWCRVLERWTSPRMPSSGLSTEFRSGLAGRLDPGCRTSQLREGLVKRGTQENFKVNRQIPL